MSSVGRRVLLCVLLITVVAVGSAVTSTANPASADGIYANGCVTYDTQLPFSVKGSQFIVRGYTADKGVATMVANALDSKHVFQTYEQTLGLTSLLQPGEDTKPLIHGEHSFPIFIDPLFKANGAVFASLCTHTTWGALVVSAKAADPETELANAYSKLFFAARDALLGQMDEQPDWWLVAMAADAVSWFDPKLMLTYDGEVTNHPETAMDDAFLPHEQGAYRFVQWILGTKGKPGPAEVDFIQNSIRLVHEFGPTEGVDKAINAFDTLTLVQEIGSFWEDHTNPKPRFGPSGLLETSQIQQQEQTVSITPSPQQLGAALARLEPSSAIKQIEVSVDNLPADVELYLNYGDDTYVRLQPGESTQALFCRTGYSPGSFLLPKTGDVRLAIETIGSAPPSSVDVKVATSTEACPKQLRIVPGLEIGPLYLGMTLANAKKVAGLVGCQQPLNYQGATVQSCIFDEKTKAYVAAALVKGRIAAMLATGHDFYTTTGIDTFYYTGQVLKVDSNEAVAQSVPGSTLDDFRNSGQGVICPSFGQNPSENRVCSYESSGYTFALTHYEKCNDDQLEDADCFWPGDQFYVSSIGVATPGAYDLITACLDATHCPIPIGSVAPMNMRRGKPGTVRWLR